MGTGGDGRMWLAARTLLTLGRRHSSCSSSDKIRPRKGPKEVRRPVALSRRGGLGGLLLRLACRRPSSGVLRQGLQGTRRRGEGGRLYKAC